MKVYNRMYCSEVGLVWHVKEVADGYGGVHGGMAFGTRNAEGERILEFGDAVGIVV